MVLKPWLCGSVNLTANENIHHEEERTSFFCCSARFRWSMHQPGYVQGGQEVGRDYLLLRIHVRRIPSDIPVNFFLPLCRPFSILKDSNLVLKSSLKKS